MKILAIGAHPDDIEFGCGPVLIKEFQKGNQIKILVLSKGEAGTVGSADERQKESQNAAKIIGAEIEFFDFGGDCHIQNTPQNAFAIARQIRIFKPDIVLAPQTDDNQHPDHANAGKIVRDACRFARYGGLEELKNLPAYSINNLYYYFITQPFGQNPDIVIDVSDLEKQWQKIMECHESQMRSKKYLELIFARASALGSAIGVKYAVGLWKNDPIRLDAISDINLSSRNY